MESSKLINLEYSSLLPPRVCSIFKWDDYEGYGFDLMTKKYDGGHYICDIYDGSPASFSGLINNDRLIEVNGINVENQDHVSVVKLIQESNSDQISLFVISSETEKWCKSNSVKVTSQLPGVIYYETPKERTSSTFWLNNVMEGVNIPGFQEQSTKSFYRFSAPEPPNSPTLPYTSTSPVSVSHSIQVNEMAKKYPKREKILSSFKTSEEKKENLKSFETLCEQQQLLEELQNIHFLNQKDLNLKSTFKVCFLKKWTNRNDYGFKLNTIKHPIHGHIINMVEENGPAYSCGLREGDYIIAINDVNVKNESHSKVVNLIKKPSSHLIKLLVGQSKAIEIEKELEKTQNISTNYESNLSHLIGSNGNFNQIECKVDQINLTQELSEDLATQMKIDQSNSTKCKSFEKSIANNRITEMQNDVSCPIHYCKRKDGKHENELALKTYVKDDANNIDVNKNEIFLNVKLEKSKTNEVNANIGKKKQMKESNVIHHLNVTQHKSQLFHSMNQQKYKSDKSKETNGLNKFYLNSVNTNSFDLEKSFKSIGSTCSTGFSTSSASNDHLSNEMTLNQYYEESFPTNDQVVISNQTNFDEQQSLLSLLKNYSAHEMQEHLSFHKSKFNRKITSDFKKKIEIFEKL